MLEIINSKSYVLEVPAPKYCGVLKLRPFELKSFEDESLLKFYEPYRAVGLVVRLNESIQNDVNSESEETNKEDDVIISNTENSNVVTDNSANSDSGVSNTSNSDDEVGSNDEVGSDEEEGVVNSTVDSDAASNTEEVVVNSDSVGEDALPEYYNYPWKDLTKYAKSLGIHTYGLDKEAILAELDKIVK